MINLASNESESSGLGQRSVPARAKTSAYRQVGQSIAMYRQRRGFSVAQLSALSSIPAADIEDYEFGISWIDSEHLMRIAEVLGVTIGDLFFPEG